MSTISMKVFNNPKFIIAGPEMINTPNDFYTYKGVLKDSNSIRIDIINAIKFIIPKDMMNFKNTQGFINININHLNGSFKEFVYDEKNDVTKHCNFIHKDDYEKYFNTWKIYGTKMPFPLMFLENDSGGILLKQKDNLIEVTVIYNNGSVPGMNMYIHTDKFTEIFSELHDFPFEHIPSDYIYRMLNDYKKDPTDFYADKFEESIRTITRQKIVLSTVGVLALHLLLFINSCNIKHIVYKPSKKELNKIPKVFKNKFEYTTIDIFRERKVYHSLEEIIKSTSSVESKEIRAHLVRGHFKHKKNGVFWWNSFIRNNKNQNIVKMKDYVLHE